MNRVNTYLQGIADRMVRLRRGGSSPRSPRSPRSPEPEASSPRPSSPRRQSTDIAQLAARIQARAAEQQAPDLPVENEMAMLIL